MIMRTGIPFLSTSLLKKNTLRLLLLLLTTGVNTRAAATDSRTIETGIILDTMNNSIQLVLDENNKPLHYRSFIFTPVCSVGECLPIKINLFWTLAGSYMKYTLPEGEILTKVDHIPFTPEDYTKLDAVLRTKLSTLRYLLKEERKQVDGVTGPTGMASKRDYVEGAIFTSLTLYSLTYGDAVEKLRSFTKKELMRDSSFTFFIDNTDPELVELSYSWLSEQLSEAELTAYILDRIQTKKEKFSGIAVKFLSEKSASDSLVQTQLINIYLDAKTPDDARSHLILLWWNKELITEVQCGLVTGLIKYKTNFDEVLFLLGDQKTWSEQVYVKLAEAIREENNMKRKTDLIRLLDTRIKNAPSEVKKYLKSVKKEMGL